jgi:hypothetical protein
LKASTSAPSADSMRWVDLSKAIHPTGNRKPHE